MTRSVALAALAALLACAHGPSPKDLKAAEIHHDLGVEALRNGRAQEALKEFDTALQFDPKFAQAHLGRGLALEFGFAKLEDAEQEYRKALALQPDYPEAQNNLGQLLAKAGRYDEALAAFDAALADLMYREPYVARCNKGQALWRMGRKEQGYAELRSCLAIAPRYCDGHRELARLLNQDGRTRESLDALNAYVANCDKRADAHWALGMARMKAGDTPGALEAFRRCVELGPTTPEGESCRKTLSALE
ncbi:MAG: tetratricopeptide repeat protein [Anaeromyxobacter sp.]